MCNCPAPKTDRDNRMIVALRLALGKNQDLIESTWAQLYAMGLLDTSKCPSSYECPF